MFPYKKISDEDANERFDNLRNLKPNFHNIPYSFRFIDIDPTYLDEYKLILYDKSEYLKYNLISDKFMDKYRVNAHILNKPSPYEYYFDNIDLIKKFAKRKYGKINDYTLRESLYILSHEPTSFKPLNIVIIIKTFKSRRILDFSAGWGDRLIGAMACDVEYYVGVDPNHDVHDGYKKIIDHFESKTKCIMIEDAFEDAKLPNKTYDLIMTSPPYFNFEIYSCDENQSIMRYPDFEDWYKNFLIFSITKSIKYLENNGYLVININNLNNVKIVERMIEDVSKLLKFCGTIGYANEKNGNPNNPQGMFVFHPH